MNDGRFILAQFGTKIELVQIDGNFMPEIGEKFERMPVTAIELWTVIKIFSDIDCVQLDAIIKLTGSDSVKKLFRTNVLNFSSHSSYEQAFDRAVSRMGGEA